MGLLFALIIGLLVGVIAGRLVRDGYDMLIMNVVFGIAGALVGLGLYAITFTGTGSGLSLFTWNAVILEALCAAIAVVIFSLLHRATPESGRINNDTEE